MWQKVIKEQQKVSLSFTLLIIEVTKYLMAIYKWKAYSNQCSELHTKKLSAYPWGWVQEEENCKKERQAPQHTKAKCSEATCSSPVSNTFCWEMGGARGQSRSETGENHPQLSIASEQITTPTGFSFLPGEHKANPSLCMTFKLLILLKAYLKKCLVSFSGFLQKLVQLFKPFSLRMIVEKFQGLYCWVRKCGLW